MVAYRHARVIDGGEEGTGMGDIHIRPKTSKVRFDLLSCDSVAISEGFSTVF